MILLFLFSLNFWINAFYIHFNTFDPSKSLSRTFLKSKHIFPHWKCAFQIVCTFHQIVAQVQSAKPSLLSLSALIDCQTQFTTKYTWEQIDRFIFKESDEFEVAESLTCDQIDRNISWLCGKKSFSCLVKFQRFFFLANESNVVDQVLIARQGSLLSDDKKVCILAKPKKTFEQLKICCLAVFLCGRISCTACTFCLAIGIDNLV